MNGMMGMSGMIFLVSWSVRIWSVVFFGMMGVVGMKGMSSMSSMKFLEVEPVETGQLVNSFTL